MKLLVTGCAGFIGSKVCRFLVDQGHTVVGVDNLNDAYDVRLKQWRLAKLQLLQKFQFQMLDIVNLTDVRKLFESKPDAVVNLAARAGVRQSVENPWVYYETNVMGTLNLLESCREHGVGKFIQASTSSLYGACNTRPFREDLNTNQPLSPYAASKKGAEALCYTYHFLHDIDVTVLRYFTVYGPAGRPDMSIFRFIRWIAEGNSLALYGNGTQERDFTFVDDIAQGTIAGLKPLGFETVNLGSDRPTTVLEVIRILENLLGRSANINHEPAHPADVEATWADISKAKNLLDWTPQNTLEEGLRQSVDWYMENRDWAKDVSLT